MPFTVWTPPELWREVTGPRVALFFVGVIFTFIAFVAIILRAITIRVRHRAIGKDDWVMLAAWICSLGFMVTAAEGYRWGVGLAFRDGPPPEGWVMKAFKTLYAIEVFYYFAIYLIKMSILLLYLRLTSGVRNLLYKGTLVLMGIVTTHFITTFVVMLAQCRPIYLNWDKTAPGSCIDLTAFFYSTNVFTIITDLMMLALPVPTFWNISVSKAQRVGIVSVFLIGGISTIASCIRLYSIRIYTQSVLQNPLRDAALITLWSFIEINVGILCASVPAIKALFVVPTRDGSGRFFFAHNADSESSSKRPQTDPFDDTKLTASDVTTEISYHKMSSEEKAENHRKLSECVSPATPLPAVIFNTDSSMFNPPADQDMKLVPGPEQHSAFAIHRGRTREDSVAGQILVKTTVTVGSEDAEDYFATGTMTEREIECQMDRLGALQKLREHGHGSFPPFLLTVSKRVGVRPSTRRFHSAQSPGVDSMH